MEVIKIATFGLAAAMTGLLCAQARMEYAFYISLAAGLIIMLCTATKLEAVFSLFAQLETKFPLKTVHMASILKMIGIAYVGQFSSGLCRDAGFSSVASQIEMFCKLSILFVSMPIFSAMLDVLQGFLK